MPRLSPPSGGERTRTVPGNLPPQETPHWISLGLATPQSLLKSVLKSVLFQAYTCSIIYCFNPVLFQSSTVSIHYCFKPLMFPVCTVSRLYSLKPVQSTIEKSQCNLLFQRLIGHCTVLYCTVLYSVSCLLSKSTHFLECSLAIVMSSSGSCDLLTALDRNFSQ